MICMGPKLPVALVLVSIAGMILVACDMWPVPRPATIGSLQLTNKDITEGVSMKSCFGQDAARVGALWIPFQRFQYRRFYVDSLREGMRCDFEYKSTADGVVHSANVLVWQGVERSTRADVTEVPLVNVVPCVHCVWWVQRDGFYRAVDRNYQEFQLMAVWHKPELGTC